VIKLLQLKKEFRQST